MNYLGLGVVGRAGARLVSSCKDLYNDLNGANLTGAVDVIAIRQADGTIKATPFHVRFGKWGVFRTGDLQKEVEIEVNGEPVSNRMMITENGSALFVTDSSNKNSSSQVSPDTPSSPDSNTPISPPSPDPKSSHDVVATPDDAITTTDDPLVAAATADVILSLGVEGKGGTQDMIGMETINRSNSESKEVALNEEQQVKEEAVVIEDETEKNLRQDYCSEEVDSVFIEENTSKIHISMLPVLDEGSISHPNEFYTPSNEFELPWQLQPVNNDVKPDTGVLSDSALDTENNLYPPLDTNQSALSDSEVERYSTATSSIKTQGDITRSLSTAEEGRLPQTATEQRSIWGKLTGILRKKKRRRYSSVEEGVYLDDLFQGYIQENEIPQFFPDPSSHAAPMYQTSPIPSSGTSGLGSSPSLSPSHHLSLNETDRDVEDKPDEIDKVVDLLSDIAISRCGGLAQGKITDEAFMNSQISFDEFCSNPEILGQPDLVFKINNKYYSWQMAAPMIMSCLLYSQTLPDSTVNNFMKSKKSRFWSFWSRTNSLEATPPEVLPTPLGETPPTSNDIWSSPVDNVSSDEGPTDEESYPSGTSKSRQRSLRRKKFVFTNELKPEELAQWPLKMGKNELVFSITTKYQGTAKAHCTLYLWDYTVKLVISDFDGTITRSDVAGQVLPLIGKDWTQNGVIELFSAINRNGYHFIYLSARAIGQSWYTKNYLRNVRRGDSYLPDGPLMVTPFSLYTAFKKEVIERIPEEFKIFCLQQIRSIFPDGYNPFHSGFGNRYSDVKSYIKVNIPISRIFTVNPKGEVGNQLTWTFQSSYKDLMELVDAQFPPVTVSVEEIDATEKSLCQRTHENYSSFVFWQQSFNNFGEVELPEI